MKKHVKILLLMFTLLLSVFLLSSCISREERALLKQNTEQFIDAVIAEDSDSAYNLVSPEITRYNFEIEFYNIRSYLSDINNYELKCISIHKTLHSQDDAEVLLMSARFLLTAESGNIVVDVETDDPEHFTSIWFTPEELTNLHYTGTLGHMSGASTAQWVFLAIGILTVLFTLITLVDSIRRKLRYKLLWILLILLASLLIRFSYANGLFNINFRPGIYFAITSLVHYGDGSMSISLFLPLGSILYYIFRKKMTITSPLLSPPEATSPESSNPSAKDAAQ